jgi:flagellar biosynthetic protein FliP
MSSTTSTAGHFPGGEMTTTRYGQPRRRHLAPWLPFIRHYIEMVLAMAIGMIASMPLGNVAFQAAGAPHLMDQAVPMTLVMVTGMALGMGAWMAWRRHGWRDIAEMTAAMYLPFVIFFPATQAGAVTGGTLMVAGHALMLAAMLAVMLRRRDHYGYRRPARPAAEAAHSGASGTADPACQRASSTALDATDSMAAVL